MLDRPQFKESFQVEIVESVGVFLLAESDYFLLTGNIYERLAAAIDGNCTTDELVDQLQPDVSPAEVYYALMMMEQKGYITDNAANLPATVATLSDTLNVDRRQAADRFSSTEVSVAAIGNVPANDFLSKLESLGLRTRRIDIKAVA